jgi:FG-GAP-like repeat/Bacterial pre-peptidase C-terminal domain/Cadherin domain
MPDDYAGSTATTGVVGVGGSITGNIESTGDEDWFRVTLTAGRSYQFDLEASATGQGTLPDPFLRLEDSAGHQISSDFDAGTGNNARITFAPSASGTYYLAANASFSSDLGTYKLSAADLGPGGDDYAATTATTGVVSVGGSITGNIESTGDEDWFRVTLTAGRSYQFDLEASATGQGTLPDPFLRLEDSAGHQISSDFDAGTGNNARITFAPSASGTYYLAANASFSSDLGTYKLSATDVSGTPNQPPHITSNNGGDTANISMVENVASVTTVIAIDADNGSIVTYSISGGEDQARFQINTSSGALSFITAPDFEAPSDSDHNNSYIVQVRASDGSLFDDQVITVNVTDVHELPNDFNADGHSDILWQNANGTPATWLMNGTSAAAFGPALTNPGTAWHEKAAADFNGDGKADILWQNDNGTPAVWLMDGTSATAFGPALANPGPAWHEKAAADFNGDGKADILWQNDNGTPAVWLMDGTSATAFGPALANPGPTWHVTAAGDFNGDGKADILWQNDDGTPAVWLMDGPNVAAYGPALANPGPAWHVTAAGDFNGDGKADILWQNDNGTPAVWLMDGTSATAFGPALANPGPAWHEKAAADFNGDGKADILWQNDNGTPAVWLMDGTNVAAIGPGLANPGSDWHII